MGGLAKSVGGFIGLDTGDKAPEGQFGNNALDQLNARNLIYNSSTGSSVIDEATKNGDVADRIGHMRETGLSGDMQQGLRDALATGSTTGSQYATQMVQQNPILGQLFGKDGLMGKEIGKEQELQNQGFELKPEDQTMYGQMSGNISRLFGQQGNRAAADLAARGMSNSGAAGATFSGLAGNQNEMLAQAQQQIAQQRFQNTMKQIGQQQQFIGQLGGQANNAINDQYQRQLAGAQHGQQSLQAAAGLTNSMNNASNNYNLGKAQFDAENKPMNIMDMSYSALGNAMGAGSKTMGQAAGKQAASSMFGGGGGAGGLFV